MRNEGRRAGAGDVTKRFLRARADAARLHDPALLRAGDLPGSAQAAGKVAPMAGPICEQPPLTNNRVPAHRPAVGPGGAACDLAHSGGPASGTGFSSRESLRPTRVTQLSCVVPRLRVRLGPAFAGRERSVLVSLGIDAGTAVLLCAAVLLALSFEFVNGFHDTANAVATVIYTHSLTPTQAVVWSGGWNLLGVLTCSGDVAFGIVALL